ncbi:MAG: hypothetical protein ACFB51_09650 [Anaerolineae bacterium]
MTRILILPLILLSAAVAGAFAVRAALAQGAVNCTGQGTTTAVCTGPGLDEAYGQTGCVLTANFTAVLPGADPTAWVFFFDGAVPSFFVPQGVVFTQSVTCESGPPGNPGSPEPGEAHYSPGIWLANVCEPFNGFSGDGQMTWDTDADDIGLPTALHVADDGDGPYIVMGYTGPPWGLTEAQLEYMANLVGEESYTGMWFKATESGKPANVGATIVERAGRMDDICNP